MYHVACATCSCVSPPVVSTAALSRLGWLILSEPKGSSIVTTFSCRACAIDDETPLLNFENAQSKEEDHEP